MLLEAYSGVVCSAEVTALQFNFVSYVVGGDSVAAVIVFPLVQLKSFANRMIWPRIIANIFDSF